MKIYERIATTHAEFTEAVTAGYDELISSLPCYELLTQFEPVAPHKDGGMIYKAYAHPAIGEALSATVIDRSMASAR